MAKLEFERSSHLFDYPVTLPAETAYDTLDIRPEATSADIRESRRALQQRCAAEKQALGRRLEAVRTSVPGLQQASEEVSRLENSPEEIAPEELRDARRRLSQLEREAARVAPNFREVRARREEVEALLRGDVTQVTPQEVPALSFAQHYAERRDQPDAEAVGHLVDAYGSQGARDIVTYVRLITLGNLVGNTFDALVSRLLGQPSPDSTLEGELSTTAVFLFGIVPLVPLVVLRSGQAPSD